MSIRQHEEHGDMDEMSHTKQPEISESLLDDRIEEDLKDKLWCGQIEVNSRDLLVFKIQASIFILCSNPEGDKFTNDSGIEGVDTKDKDKLGDIGDIENVLELFCLIHFSKGLYSLSDFDGAVIFSS